MKWQKGFKLVGFSARIVRPWHSILYENVRYGMQKWTDGTLMAAQFIVMTPAVRVFQG